MVDVRPAEQIDDRTATVFERTGELCERLGWRYPVISDITATEHRNLRFLSGYRFDRWRSADATQRLRNRSGQGAALSEWVSRLRGSAPDPLGAVFSALWWRELVVDVSRASDDGDGRRGGVTVKARIGARLTWDGDEFVVIAIDYRVAWLRSLSEDYVREVIVEELVRISDVVWHDTDATVASPIDLRVLDELPANERAVLHAWVERLELARKIIDAGGDSAMALEDARAAMVRSGMCGPTRWQLFDRTCGAGLPYLRDIGRIRAWNRSAVSPCRQSTSSRSCLEAPTRSGDC